MCSPIVTVQAAVSSASLVQHACSTTWLPWYERGETKLHSLQMKWVVVTDTNGTRRPEMRWWFNSSHGNGE